MQTPLNDWSLWTLPYRGAIAEILADGIKFTLNVKLIGGAIIKAADGGFGLAFASWFEERKVLLSRRLIEGVKFCK